MNLKEMIQRQQELLNAAKAANREFTAEEQAEFDSLQKSIDSLKVAQPEEKSAAPSVNTGEIERSAKNAERARIREIEAMCEHFGIEAKSYIDSDMPVDKVRAAIMDTLMSEGEPVSQRTADVQATTDESDKFRAAAVDALIMRSGEVRIDKPAEGAAELRGMALKDLAIEAAARDGQDARSLIKKSASDLYDELSYNRAFYNPSAAFPAIMDQTIRKSIVEMYNHVDTTFQFWTTKGSLSDFKETADHEYVIGGVGDFLKVPENGEIKMDTPQTELLPTRKLETYGKAFSMTRQAFVNDDIGFCTRVPGLYAVKAKQTIDKQCYNILFGNPVIFDGVNLFDAAAHKNVMATGAAPSQAVIQNMITKMMLQTDQFGEAIYVTPEKIIVPVGWGFDLDVIFKSAQSPGNGNNDFNPLSTRKFQIIESPVLNALAGTNACPWFMASSATSARGIQVDYLNGQELPTVKRYDGTPGTLGYHWDIYLDWGIAVRDFRGLLKNPGAVLASL